MREFRKGAQGDLGGAPIAVMITRLIEIADRETSALSERQQKGEELDPRKFRELVNAVKDLRDLQRQATKSFHSRTSPNGDEPDPADERPPSPVLDEALAKLRAEDDE